MNSKLTRHVEETAAKGRRSSGVQEPVLGLRQNLGQFSLLVLVNAFVGGMVGLERVNSRVSCAEWFIFFSEG
jgi:hypothetical protein